MDQEGSTTVQRPTVGRIVHYYGPKVEGLIGGAGPIAALVTDVLPLGECQLSLFPPMGGPLDMHAVRSFPAYVPFDDSDPPLVHSWRWPPRV